MTFGRLLNAGATWWATTWVRERAWTTRSDLVFFRLATAVVMANATINNWEKKNNPPITMSICSTSAIVSHRTGLQETSRPNSKKRAAAHIET